MKRSWRSVKTRSMAGHSRISSATLISTVVMAATVIAPSHPLSGQEVHVNGVQLGQDVVDALGEELGIRVVGANTGTTGRPAPTDYGEALPSGSHGRG